MKLSAILLSTIVGSSIAFHVSFTSSKPRQSVLKHGSPLFESTFDVEVASTTSAKEDLMETAQSLKDEFGALIIDTNAQERLKAAVEVLENSADPPTDASEMIGEWTLLCSTASAEKVKGVDTSKLPFYNEGPVKEIRDTLNKSLMVQQVIKSEESTSDGVDRVDHVIQYMPPDTLSEFVSTLPDFLQSLNINPFQVTDQKVVLVHKAEVESVIPFIKTKLSLQSVVVNVAGKSQNLDPTGADILGINIPFGEFLNSGTFDTTYMDDELRVSRSKVGPVEQLRVFVRASSSVVEEETSTEEEIVMVEEKDEDEEVVDEISEAPSDVEEEPQDDAEDIDVEAPSDVESED